MGACRAWRSPRAVLLMIAAAILLSLRPGPAAGTGVSAFLPPEVQARVCNQLRAYQAAFAAFPSAAQALETALARYGCTGSGGTTTTFPGTTSTTFHEDCQLPGGGIGPCPTTTTSIPNGPSTSGPGTTGVPPTTLPPCTSTTGFPPTTIPGLTTTSTMQTCQPARL